MTKAQEIQQRVDALIVEGKPRADAFKQLAAELGIKYDSVRGAYYTAGRQAALSSRVRRRIEATGCTVVDGTSGSAQAKPHAAITRDMPQVIAVDNRRSLATAKGERHADR